MCPFELLRFYKKTRREQEEDWTARNIAPCSKATTNVIDPLHECKKVCPKRNKRGRETGKTEARRLMERKVKNIIGTKTRPTQAQLRLTKRKEGTMNFP